MLFYHNIFTVNSSFSPFATCFQSDDLLSKVLLNMKNNFFGIVFV